MLSIRESRFHLTLDYHIISKPHYSEKIQSDCQPSIKKSVKIFLLEIAQIPQAIFHRLGVSEQSVA